METQNKTLRVLVGDDQIGARDSLQQRAFLRNYEQLAEFDFSENADDFIMRARNGKYDALLIDLNWEGERNTQDTTGFRILHAVRDCSPIRLLHTSNEITPDLKCALGLLGATGYIEKYRGRNYMDTALKGGIKL